MLRILSVIDSLLPGLSLVILCFKADRKDVPNLMKNVADVCITAYKNNLIE